MIFIEIINFCVCLIFLIFLENKIIPQGLYFFKKDFSFLESDKPLIPQIKDLQFLFVIIK